MAELLDKIGIVVAAGAAAVPASKATAESFHPKISPIGIRFGSHEISHHRTRTPSDSDHLAEQVAQTQAALSQIQDLYEQICATKDDLTGDLDPAEFGQIFDSHNSENLTYGADLLAPQQVDIRVSLRRATELNQKVSTLLLELESYAHFPTESIRLQARIDHQIEQDGKRTAKTRSAQRALQNAQEAYQAGIPADVHNHLNTARDYIIPPGLDPTLLTLGLGATAIGVGAIGIQLNKRK